MSSILSALIATNFKQPTDQKVFFQKLFIAATLNHLLNHINNLSNIQHMQCLF